MFGIGIGELIFIVMIGLTVLGPERLCHTIKTLSRTFRSSRAAIQQITQDVSDQLAVSDIERALTSVEQEITLPELTSSPQAKGQQVLSGQTPSQPPH
ncbi:hypothetical protein KCM76_20780 [Zooshikella marina]|uniref:Sec-independent protein translocase subunit TatA/TatB n=1 Tax=Zooshikella ganghwensis TaxID=202772 RepID=UPI001BB0D7BE|nr:twin-arginine translocase TatA/TatE family subunit [Zooshikella ganghwensis]MBU2708441.1 hypothetical protein [Zooshikella ganghwensis]